MIRCLTLLALISLTCSALAADAPRTAPDEPKGMRRIFNGKDLTGWDGDPRLWSVKDGAIRGETTAQVRANGNTFIIWKGGVLKDFELRLSLNCSVESVLALARCLGTRFEPV